MLLGSFSRTPEGEAAAARLLTSERCGNVSLQRARPFDASIQTAFFFHCLTRDKRRRETNRAQSVTRESRCTIFPSSKRARMFEAEFGVPSCEQ